MNTRPHIVRRHGYWRLYRSRAAYKVGESYIVQAVRMWALCSMYRRKCESDFSLPDYWGLSLYLSVPQV